MKHRTPMRDMQLEINSTKAVIMNKYQTWSEINPSSIQQNLPQKPKNTKLRAT